MLQFQRLVQRITVSGASVCPDCGAHSAPLSPMVFGVSLMDPSLETHMALTIVSLTSHIAGFDIAPLATDLTTRN